MGNGSSRIIEISGGPPPRLDRRAIGQSDSSNPSDKILYKTGLGLLEKHQYKEARLAFQKLIATYPDSDLAATSYFAIGDSFNDEGGAADCISG